MNSYLQTILILALAGLIVSGCDDSSAESDADTDADTDGDADTDADTDGDADGDADADSDGDIENGGDADGDDDVDADAVSDGGDIPDELRESVLRLAEPLVDPTGADTSRAVGLVVVLVSESITGVIGVGALVAGSAGAPDGDTVFQIGSVTKILTGLILANLVTEGVVGANDPVNDHLADDITTPSFNDEWISLVHLVSHYSSLPEMPDNTSGPSGSPAADYSRAQLGEFLGGLTLDEAPGSSYLYSNLGSGLLGVALADTTGEADYEGLLRTHVTVPLGMTDTSTNEPDFIARVEARLAQGYAVRADELVPFAPADMGVLAGGGEVLSTGHDMARLLRMFTGLDETVAPTALDLALTPLGPGAGGTRIAFAIDVITQPDGTLQFEKAGVTAGYTSFVTFRREPAVGVAILSNRSQYRALQTTAREMLELLVEGD